MMKLNFPFHLVSSSPWPLMTSLSIMLTMLGTLQMITEKSSNLILLSTNLMIMCTYQWWRDVMREATLQGSHSLKVMEGLKMGMLLFITSELMFFFSFFWTYYHMFLSPSISLGSLIPPMNVVSFYPYNIPLLNTLILLSSGVSITLCHHSILKNKFYLSMYSFIITLFLGVIFTTFQYMEYYESSYTMADSMYGSIFFLATGFHGIHVIIGTLFIFISLWRFMNKHLSSFHHFNFEAASWYWHFVDVVWLFLYISIYWLPM